MTDSQHTFYIVLVRDPTDMGATNQFIERHHNETLTESWNDAMKFLNITAAARAVGSLVRDFPELPLAHVYVHGGHHAPIMEDSPV